MTKLESADLADRFIGAAQALDAAAKAMKAQAKHLRAGWVPEHITTEHWLMFRENEVRCACEAAMTQLQTKQGGA